MGITSSEFDALVELLNGGRVSAANQAARLVLVYDVPQAEAARSTGVKRSTVSDAVKRCTQLDQTLRKAYRIEEGKPRVFPPMHAEHFDFLVALLRGKPETAANKAARMVLVKGLSQAQAMAFTGATRSTVCDAVHRYNGADQMIRKAYGITSGETCETND